MLIEHSLKNKLKIEHISMISRFPSKKNSVFKVSLDTMAGPVVAVLKVFSTTIAKDKEVVLLDKLSQQGLPVPPLLAVGHQQILIEHIAGDTLLQILETAEAGGMGCMPKIWSGMQELLAWLEQYYQITKVLFKRNYMLGDINLRNFILGHRLYGFDFEDSGPGDKEDDLGRLCAFLLTYQPAFTPFKRTLAEKLFASGCHSLSLQAPLVIDAFETEMQAIALRRCQKICPQDVTHMKTHFITAYERF